ncbi:hypothetical protein [Thauera linaloolentis]|uniref:hypothetical protein n=1 Tax=Thauera linaloolentis TaxID=76112 RepID=UPI00138DEFF3|nr:hypothetical protein [Thauera linaloolentis]MCM8567319.1 hypothetical protein [Thauera linaloolentis]
MAIHAGGGCGAPPVDDGGAPATAEADCDDEASLKIGNADIGEAELAAMLGEALDR